ncbi:MAG: aspartyl protease family protein [Pseudomonadota bacterium]|uniref:Aspartyl protease family protein n=1 Tax=Sphingomonas echinoides TaxID=59803 RepID=A0ABU4PLE7_9SPHN|nr:aspartyl protease family protein [Sphingomonas echinoides]MDX5983962.1 aspartyl protease family protein [Sphingomonas echinoides]
MFLFFLLCAAAPDAPPIPHASATRAREAEAPWVAFTLTPAEQICFQAVVDGHPVAAILDTGVSTSLLSRRFVDAARMRVRGGHAALAIGGTVASGWVDPSSVTIAAHTVQNPRLMTAPLPPATTGQAAIDLLVGSDMIAHYALDIDYAAQRFRLLPSGSLPFAGNIAPLRIGGEWSSYVTDLLVGTHHLSRMAIDTGDGSAITVTRGAWSALAEQQRPTSSTISYGVGGAAIVDLAIVPGVRSGAAPARTVEMRIEPSGGYTATIGMNGRIGSGFLRHYRVLLDPHAGRMVLLPGSSVDTPPLRSTSGLILRRDDDRLTVLHVMRGGPAEADGWQAGEQICAVDGLPVSAQGTLHWPVDTAGRSVRLATCTGVTRTLTLRAFY